MPARRSTVFARTLLHGCLIAGLCLLGACAAPPPSRPGKAVAPPSLTAPYAAKARAGKSVYRLDETESRVWILVDKEGPLASFGHRHVIEVGRLEGFASVIPGGTTRADVRFPVTSLQVDRPDALAHFGIKEKLSDADRTGTRDHMLGKSVLDAGRYPWVDLQIHIADTNAGSVPLKAVIRLHGTQHALNLTATLAHPPRRWTVTGGFPIKQTRFGITPYSVMLGALRVKDEIEIRYDLVFVPWNP